MIVVKLQGGMGNQLFQYAAGRALADKNNTELRLDVYPFKKYKVHDYSLSPFSFEEKFDERGSLARLLGHGPRRVVEEGHPFDPSILELGDDVYLEGYWQTEKYFASIAPTIRQELQVATPQEGRDLKLQEEMNASCSVSLHVRRGDYITNPRAAKVHGLCSLDYYKRAVEEMGKRVGDLHLFLFSDDPAWVKENMAFSYPITVVDHNGREKNYEDLRLMSQCKHHILANSSFSWWGAWLNPSKDKVVIAPKQWFAKEEIDTRDVLPEEWLTL